MRTILVVTADEALRDSLLRGLQDRSVFWVSSEEEALRRLRLTEVDLIVKEVTPPVPELPAFIARARHVCPAAVVLCVAAEPTAVEEGEWTEVADFVLLRPFTGRHLEAVLRQAEEKLQLLQEVSALRAARNTVPVPPPAAGPSEEEPGGGHWDVSPPMLAQVVKEFARTLAAGFDLPRVLDVFLDGVSEMARPTRTAILLPDPDLRRYRVRASRGLAPYVIESVSLPADSGLALWLATEGRLIQIDEVQARLAEPLARDIKRDLSVLQAVLAIPLLCRGELVAILTLGQRITGAPHSRPEVEILFSLATHLAAAIRDIRMHHLLQYEKVFNERILAHMASGVITISPEQKVVIMNRRAEEILGMAARDVLNRDLRVLPSPLGDLLFETLTRGRTVTRSEVQLALGNLPLEISTYPVVGEGSSPLGAVLVFEDLTAQRQLAQEKRSAEQLQLLARLVARIADEIKNPLVSISTFMELLQDRYEDASFRQHFASVVGRDIRRLVQIFEKLTALVNEDDYRIETVDLKRATEECLTELGAHPVPSAGASARLLTFTDESTLKNVVANFSHEGSAFLVRGNNGMLRKALSYLVWYLLRKSPGQDAKISVILARQEAENHVVRLVVASRTADVRPDELQRLFDPIQVVQENLIDVGPCVSQRIIERLGGRLEVKQTRSEVSFIAALATAQR
jgi:signal transduction histidine kinase